MKLSRTIILISFLLISFMWKFDMLYAQTRPVQEGETIIGPVTASYWPGSRYSTSSSNYSYSLSELQAYQILVVVIILIVLVNYKHIKYYSKKLKKNIQTESLM